MKSGKTPTNYCKVIPEQSVAMTCVGQISWAGTLGVGVGVTAQQPQICPPALLGTILVLAPALPPAVAH